LGEPPGTELAAPRANKALAQCGLGFFVPIDICDATVRCGSNKLIFSTIEVPRAIISIG
jgi:hypothetical protein